MDPVQGHPIILFDGECNLCNGTVDFVVRRDRVARFRFAPLQGETAAALHAAAPESAAAGAPANPLRSVLLWQNGMMYAKSSAGLRVLAGLGGFWRLFAAFLVVPRPIRDAIYDWIARNRYRWFGRRESCRMPEPGERDRFLP